MKKIKIASILYLWIISTAAHADLVLHVDPTGNDLWSGKISTPSPNGHDGPLASLAGARDAIRKLRDGNTIREPITVLIHDGEYPLKEPVIFDSRDSGTADAPITYQAAPGAKPVFSGGVRITDWTVTPNEWTARPIRPDGKPLYFESLYANGERLTRARSPNQGFFFMAGKTPAAQAGDKTEAKQAFMARPEDIAELRSLDAKALAAVDIIIYHAWQVSHHRIADIDFSSGLVKLTAPAPWPLMRHDWDNHQRFIIDNNKGALDNPGEWFLDLSGTLHYKPNPEDRPDKLYFVAPVTDQFLLIEKSTPENSLVQNISFENLIFEYAAYKLPDRGHQDRQGSPTLPAAITLVGAKDIKIENATIRHIDLYAIWVRYGSSNIKIVKNILNDLGGGGIKIGETDIVMSSIKPVTTNSVIGNIIKDGGQRFPGSIGIWIGQSSNNLIAYNNISNFYYSGISAGWTWSYTTSLSTNNHIEFNEINNIGQGLLSDMGGIYTLGPSLGTTIRNNVIHDVISYNYGGWGIYNDAASSDILVENNLVFRTKSGGYHLGHGKNILVQNNIFLKSQGAQIRRNKAESFHALTFRHNIVEGSTDTLFEGEWIDTGVNIDSNLYFTHSNPEYNAPTAINYPLLNKIQDISSLIADPLFIDFSNDDYHLQKDSPAYKINFHSFDYLHIGYKYCCK